MNNKKASLAQSMLVTMLGLLTITSVAKRSNALLLQYRHTIPCFTTRLSNLSQTRTLKLERAKTTQYRSSNNSDNYESSWMDKNKRGNDFSNESSSAIRDNFQSTRVFVQNIPKHVSWQTLKDHFRTAGNVVFASVSIDQQTNQSKGQGIVQFATTEEAQNAIQIMRNYPMEELNGSSVNLYVRADHQEKRNSNPSIQSRSQQYQQRSVWKCANDSQDDLSTEEYSAVLSIIKARDSSRKRKNYEASDNMREQLKTQYNIHLDDRLKLWWKDVSLDASGVVPQSVQDLKGDGHWKNEKPSQQSEEWRQIPTTPEKDACVDSNLVNALLTQRDIARMEKDYFTADSLLEQATYAPNEEGFKLRIHDASRTWRVWSDEPPQPKVRPSTSSNRGEKDSNERLGPVEECMALVSKYDPDKKEEVMNLLQKFPGREYNILKKLKQRYTE